MHVGDCMKGSPMNLNLLRSILAALAVGGVMISGGKAVISQASADVFGSGASSFVARPVTIRTVALSRDQAPGMPVGVKFNYFESIAPTINELGQIAFQARLVIGNDSEYSSIWSEGSGALASVAVVGMPAPGIPLGRPFVSLGGPAINDAGATVFHGTLAWRNSPESPGDVVFGYHAGIWSDRGGTPELVLRLGDPAPGAPGGIAFDSQGYRFNDLGKFAFLARFDYRIGDDHDAVKFGIWSESGDGLRLIALAGVEAPGVENGSFRQLYAPLLNNRGHVVFKGVLQPTLTSALLASRYGIWSDRGGSVALVLREGQHLPTTASSSAPATGFHIHAFNGRDNIAFSASVKLSATEHRQGIWLERNNAISPIMLAGDWAPGTPANVIFKGASTFVLNDSGQIAFFGTLEPGHGALIGQNLRTHNDSGIWFHDGEELGLIAKVGDLVSNDPIRTRLISLSSPMLNARGQVAFKGWATTDEDAGNESAFSGLWVADPGCQPRLVVRTGVPIDVDNGAGIDLRTLVSIDFPSSPISYGSGVYSGADDGRGRSFNDRGQLAFHGSFEDGSYGIFVVNTFPIPEPNSVVFTGLGALVLLGTRRYSQSGAF
jgi:hypothetical protein